MEVPPKRGPPKFKLFNLSSWTHEIFKVNKYKGKIKFDKIWGHRNGGVPLKRGRQNSNFLTTHARHIKFSGLANMKT